MARPKKERMVDQPPLHYSFKPTGIPRKELDQIELTLDEYEAVRLADYRGFEHETAAGEMGISRSTFTRLIEKAHQKISAFLVEGKELCIAGGCVHFRENIIKCTDCGKLIRTGFESEITSCPHCGSMNLIDTAGGYGHGRCCGEYSRLNSEEER